MNTIATAVRWLFAGGQHKRRNIYDISQWKYFISRRKIQLHLDNVSKWHFTTSDIITSFRQCLGSTFSIVLKYHREHSKLERNCYEFINNSIGSGTLLLIVACEIKYNLYFNTLLCLQSSLGTTSIITHCSPVLASQLHTSAPLCRVVSGKYRITKKRDKPLTYEMANPPHYIAHRKSWNSWNTCEFFIVFRSYYSNIYITSWKCFVLCFLILLIFFKR